MTFKTVSWKTGPNRGQFKQQPKNKKLIKKYADAWAKANGYKLQAPSLKLQAPSSKLHEKDIIK
jgi:hypothetical protein